MALTGLRVRCGGRRGHHFADPAQ